MQAMERRYTVLADQQGKLAAEKEKLSSEKQALIEVLAADLQTCVSLLVPPRTIRVSVAISLSLLNKVRRSIVQDLRVCKVEVTKMQADFFEKDSLLQRKEVEVCGAPPFLY